jgi:hypothetical protein
MNRTPVKLFVLLGIGVAVILAFFVSPLASSEPDGLERVAIDQGFESQAAEHHFASGPLADYGVAGVSNPSVSTGLSGIIGVALCFFLAAGLILAIRWVRRRSAVAVG